MIRSLRVSKEIANITGATQFTSKHSLPASHLIEKPYLVGIDLGTSSLKSVIIDQDGQLHACAAQPYAIVAPHPGWAEQDPMVWVRAMIETVRRAVSEAQIAPDQIAAIGLSGQMHGMVCLDDQGRVLRPAILWADQRSAEQVSRAELEMGRKQWADWTGNPLDTGFMLASWLWLRENEPVLARQAAHLLLPKDYLRYRMTLVLGAEPSDAGSTGLFSPTIGAWSDPLLALLEIESELLPPIQASAKIAGGLIQEVARETGIATGTPVVYGGGDQACQALGNGILEPGDVSCTIGTGGQLLTPTRTPTIDPQLRLHCYNHAVPEMWFNMGVILSAGLSLTWLRDNFLLDMNYQEMADLAMQAPPGSDGLIFLPHLAGVRTPYMDPSARGAFIGLTLHHDRRHLCRAVMEGVVFALKQVLDLMIELGIPVERIIASGGATNHPLWLQLQSDIFNRPIHLTQTIEAAAVGAALLAGIGAGVFTDAWSAVHQIVRWRDEITMPEPKNVDSYVSEYEAYLRL